MMNRSKARVFLRVVAAMCFALGCSSKGDDDSSTTSGDGTGNNTSSGSGGNGAVNGTTGTGGHASPGGSTGNNGNSGGMKGGAGSSSPTGGEAGDGATHGGGGTSGTPGDGGMTSPPVKLAASVRNPKYQSVAPPMGEPLPAGMPGMWTYTDIDGAVSRDGSPAGFYYKPSATGNKNLLIYLAGGGACQDNFFCNMNPPNKSMSLTAESIGSGVLNVAGPSDEAQNPSLERWQSGIFKDDQANPVKDWNMVFIPYVTGDVFAV